MWAQLNFHQLFMRICNWESRSVIRHSHCYVTTCKCQNSLYHPRVFLLSRSDEEVQVRRHGSSAQPELRVVECRWAQQQQQQEQKKTLRKPPWHSGFLFPKVSEKGEISGIHRTNIVLCIVQYIDVTNREQEWTIKYSRKEHPSQHLFKGLPALRIFFVKCIKLFCLSQVFTSLFESRNALNIPLTMTNIPVTFLGISGQGFKKTLTQDYMPDWNSWRRTLKWSWLIQYSIGSYQERGHPNHRLAR